MDVSCRCMQTREGAGKVYSGDIAAAVGFKYTTTGDTICDEQHPVILESMEFPEPVIELAIEPKTKAGQDKMGIALAKLAEEDPTFRAHTDQETGQTIIAGMGELHLEIIVDRLLREFKVEANVGAPQVAYKETFTNLLMWTANMQDSPVVVDSTVTVKLNSSLWIQRRGDFIVRVHRCRRRDPEGIYPCCWRRYRRGSNRLVFWQASLFLAVHATCIRRFLP